MLSTWNPYLKTDLVSLSILFSIKDLKQESPGEYILQKTVFQCICCKCFCVITWYQKISLQPQKKQYNHTQLHKVNNYDFYFVLKCFHISNSRTKRAGIDA